MSTLNPERWREISPLLDRALSLSEIERSAWVESFRSERPELADVLEILLEEHRALAEERFLERLPAPTAIESSQAGQTVGAYRLMSPIGQGGMGSVWLAERSDGRFERRVAVKFLHFTLAASGSAERFKREGKILGQLQHPHIAELIDAGVTPSGEPYLVLEHVDGEAIDQYCDQRELTVEARISLFLDVINAVAHAHANLVVHRDIKPSNLLVRKDGQAKLLDFGIAKLLASDGNAGSATLSLEGGGALTPLFAAPEQVTDGGITTATDVYALGVLLYVLLTGQHPAGPGPHSPADLVKAITETEPPLASQAAASAGDIASAAKRGATPEKLSRRLRGDLDTIVAKALKKKTQERYASATAFGDDLRRYLSHEPIAARRDTVAYRALKFARRNRLSTSATAFALTAIFAVSGIAIYQARVSQRRFQDVRKLAHTFVFDLHDEVAKLEGSTKSREMMVQTGLQYLDDLAQNAGSDLDLQREIAGGYAKIGDAQGYPTKANLGRIADALASYRKADEIYERIASRNTAYLPDLAQFYLNYAGLVRFTDDRARARALSELAVKTFDRIHSQHALSGKLEIPYTQAWCTLGDLDEDAGHYTQAWKEFSRCGELARARLDGTKDQETTSWLSQADERIATAAQELGLLEQALRLLDEDESLLNELLVGEPHNPQLHRRLALVYDYRAEVYYSDLSPSLGDPFHALKNAQLYLQAAEARVRNDPSNTSAHFSRAVATYWVSFSLRESDANAAIKLARDSVRMFDQMIAQGKPNYLLTSRRVRAFIRLGEAQLRAHRLEEAASTAEVALSAERPIAAGFGAEGDDERSELVQVLILAGRTESAMGRYERAEGFLQEALTKAKQIAQSEELMNAIPLANANQALGTFYASRHQTRQAREHYEELSRLWQRFPSSNQYVKLQQSVSEHLLASLH